MTSLTNEIKESSYPFNRVGWGYSLLGGSTGGLMVGVLFIFDYQGIELLLIFIVSSIVLGAVFGLIPSIITGVWIVKNEMKIQGAENYCKLFLMGFLVSSTYAVSVVLLNYYIFEWFLMDNFSLQLFSFTGGMGLLGGLSSMILGKLLLPKEKTLQKS
ncbi:hypothetical protein [Psychrobacter fozii]|uniref:hypothetical protein n=1 Tax=Psychrobacter fozii TaxID=198480 RepID=UPI001918D2C3|nr:hypothetical protein [Psychrobacter fozii]